MLANQIVIGSLNFMFDGLREIEGQEPLHLIDAFRDIVIDGEPLPVVYQTGIIFKNGVKRAPNRELELSSAGGTHPVFIKIHSLNPANLIDTDYLNMQLMLVKKIYPAINSIGAIVKIYKALNSGIPKVSDLVNQ